LNYLAHAYLSFNDPEILVGNLISDYVKGRKKFDYSPRIQVGIYLHRAIDTFTDDHPVTKETKKIFADVYRLYSGAFMDVVYDHFLAKDQAIFPGDDLLLFSEHTYRMLEMYEHFFPGKFSVIFPYMKKFNWFYNYQFEKGIERSFEGLVRRAAYLDESENAYRLFIKNYQQLEEAYHQFFPELLAYARDEFNKISS